MIKLGSSEIKELNYDGDISKAYIGNELIYEKDLGILFTTKSTAGKSRDSIYIPFDFDPIDEYVIHNDHLIKYIIIDDTYKVYKKDFDIGYGSFILKNGVEAIKAEISQGIKIVVVCEKY